MNRDDELTRLQVSFDQFTRLLKKAVADNAPKPTIMALKDTRRRIAERIAVLSAASDDTLVLTEKQRGKLWALDEADGTEEVSQ
jgi:hypothetical protein